MNYYKDNNSDDIYAYDDMQLEQVARMGELEVLIKKEEPAYLTAVDSQRNAEIKISELTDTLSNAELSDEDIADIHQSINTESCKRDESINKQARYYELVVEYQQIPDAFSVIRKNTQEMAELSEEDVDAITNPPISHEQLVADAEVQKQYLIAEVQTETQMLQTKLALGRIKEDEKARLNAWLDYLDELEAVDVSTAPDITWPAKPDA